MEQGGTEWPATPWRLTAAESYVLRYTPSAPSGETFKLALKELVVRRALLVEPVEIRGRFGRTKWKRALREGPQPISTTEPTLAPVLRLYRQATRTVPQLRRHRKMSARGLDGILVEDFARAARRELKSFDTYRDRHVVPTLVQRGLFGPEEYTKFSVPRTRLTWTSAGREVDAELERWLTVGRERLRDWVSKEPRRALAYAAGAGAAILLMSDLHPELERLGEHARLHANAALDGPGLAVAMDDLGLAPDTEAGGSKGSTDPETDPAERLGDLGGIDLGDLGGIDFSGLDFDLGALEGVGSAFSAIDLGVAIGGGGGGGGNGGGGNGGGGGG